MGLVCLELETKPARAKPKMLGNQIYRSFYLL